ncbi:MAG: hypothetical protein HY243_15510 [Proteobacteria bacterium]|nr:hypothetical protein [Pseudomonadota bacterium]
MNRIFIIASLAVSAFLLPVASFADSDSTSTTDTGKKCDSTDNSGTNDTGIGKGSPTTANSGTTDTGIGKGTPGNVTPGTGTTDTNGKSTDCP